MRQNIFSLFLLLLSHSFALQAPLENSNIVTVLDSINSSNFGKVLFSNHQKLQFFAPSFYPTNKNELISQSDTSLHLRIEHYQYDCVNLDIIHQLNSGYLQTQIQTSFTKTCEINSGLGLNFSNQFDSVSSWAHGYEKSTSTVQEAIDRHFSFEHNLKLFDSEHNLLFINRNPFTSSWDMKQENLRLNLIDTLTPFGANEYNTLEGPTIASTFTPSDTLTHIIETHFSASNTPGLFLSEHPNSALYSMTMFWDELPNSSVKDGWNFMTTEGDKSVEFDHYFIKLMNEHPRLKMGYLVVYDELPRRSRSYFSDWSTYSAAVMPDSLDEFRGDWCVSMLAEKTGTHLIYQKVPVDTNSNYKLSYYIKADSIESPYGAYSQIKYPNYQDNHTGSPQLKKTDWKLVEHIFPSYDNDSITLELRLQHSTGLVFFDNIKLVKAGDTNNILKNPSFESNTPQIHYDNKRRHWSDARGPYSFNQAPTEFKQFLQRIERNDTLYGWENRVSLGGHGLHHTPSLSEPNSPAPGWEFQWYDPYGDSLRINRIFELMKSVNLTPEKSFSFWRSPGFKYTKSLIDLLVDNQVNFIDAFKAKQPYSTKSVQRFGKKSWLISLSWWGDFIDGNHYWLPQDSLYSKLNHGHLGLIGAHPNFLFFEHQANAYQKFDSLLSNYEKNYEGFQYLLPEEYSQNATQSSSLIISPTPSDGIYQNYQIKGEVSMNTTFYINGPLIYAKLNNQNLDSKYYPIKNITTFQIKSAQTSKNSLSLLPKTKKMASLITDNKPKLFLRGQSVYLFNPTGNPISVQVVNTSGMLVQEVTLPANSEFSKIFTKTNQVLFYTLYSPTAKLSSFKF